MLFQLLPLFMALPKICIRRKLNFKPRGFTVIEILVVIFLLAILSGMTLVFSTSYYREYNFYGEEKMLIGLLQKARSQALSNINQKPHGIFFDKTNNSYVLFQGNDYADRDSGMDFSFRQNGSFSLTGLDQVIFSQLSGDSASTGDIILDDHVRPKITISINQEGRIDAH